MATVMWEIRAANGRLDELLDWALGRLDPSARVYRSNGGEPRLVVIDGTGQAATQLADPRRPDRPAGTRLGILPGTQRLTGPSASCLM